jgi:hypothetical protein
VVLVTLANSDSAVLKQQEQVAKKERGGLLEEEEPSKAGIISTLSNK